MALIFIKTIFYHLKINSLIYSAIKLKYLPNFLLQIFNFNFCADTYDSPVITLLLFEFKPQKWYSKGIFIPKKNRNLPLNFSQKDVIQIYT